MEILVGFAIYMLIGILGRMVFGYRGLVETILWPVGIPCAVLLKRMEVNDEIDQIMKSLSMNFQKAHIQYRIMRYGN